jgi:hypothetical protein
MAGREPIVTDDPADNSSQSLHDSFGSQPERDIQRDISEGTHERFSFWRNFSGLRVKERGLRIFKKR